MKRILTVPDNGYFLCLQYPELLRLCQVNQLDMEWILKQQRGLRRFRHSMGAQGIGGVENSRYLDLLKSASQAGLSSTDAAHLAAMPELTQMAIAVYTSASEKIALPQCLKATQACMHLLPFPALEASLRSPLWADEEAQRPIMLSTISDWSLCIICKACWINRSVRSCRHCYWRKRLWMQIAYGEIIL